MDKRDIIISKDFSVDDATEFREKVYQLINNGERYFVLDFSKCEFVDSTGLGVLVSIHKKCLELNGRLLLSKINKEVMRLFNLTRLDQVFEII
ncbi:MAG: STAS domain-containing protein [Vallitalea sp.]|jgi:anti-sigma B factor antagonist|nr:STAS domain-containing protein [Vallitalea sp.]